MTTYRSRSRAKLAVYLTPVEIDHVLSLLAHNAGQDGFYSGPRDQYWARHNRIVKAFAVAVEEPT